MARTRQESVLYAGNISIRLGAKSLGGLRWVNMLSCLRSLFRSERRFAVTLCRATAGCTHSSLHAVRPDKSRVMTRCQLLDSVEVKRLAQFEGSKAGRSSLGFGLTLTSLVTRIAILSTREGAQLSRTPDSSSQPRAYDPDEPRRHQRQSVRKALSPQAGTDSC